MADDSVPSNDPQAQDDPQTTQPSALPEDNGTPFQAPDDVHDDLVLGDAHQATDNASDIDSQQFYDEGLAAAANAGEPAQDPVPEENDDDPEV